MVLRPMLTIGMRFACVPNAYPAIIMQLLLSIGYHVPTQCLSEIRSGCFCHIPLHFPSCFPSALVTQFKSSVQFPDIRSSYSRPSREIGSETVFSRFV